MGKDDKGKSKTRAKKVNIVKRGALPLEHFKIISAVCTSTYYRSRHVTRVKCMSNQ